MSGQTSVVSNHALAQPSSAQPFPVDLFLTNLRLLDLDKRYDWPGITVRTLAERPGKDGQPGQKHRIKCVEWALYNLFQIWDGEETREKLQPFVPPLEPLQSLNLRAALYRSLNELKKNGVLGRESILRKTMLDECKGEKFVEILVLFSAAVLRKVQVEIDRTSENRHFSYSMRLATSQLLDSTQQTLLLPLSIVHQASLTSRLEEKAGRRSRCKRFNELLDQKIQQLGERLETCEKAVEAAVDKTEETAIKRQLITNWPGNTKWHDAVIYGDEEPVGDAPLKRPFSEVWDVIVDGGVLQPEATSTGSLANLERRVQQQNDKWKGWRTFHKKIAGSTNAGAGGHMAQKLGESGSATSFKFGRHGALLMRPAIPPDDLAPLAVYEAPASVESHGNVISRMNRGISGVSRSRRQGGAGWTNRSEINSKTLAFPQANANGLRRLPQSLSSPSSPPCQNIQFGSDQTSVVARKAIPERSFSPSLFFSPVKGSSSSAQPDSFKASSIANTSLSGISKLNRLRLLESPSTKDVHSVSTMLLQQDPALNHIHSTHFEMQHVNGHECGVTESPAAPADPKSEIFSKEPLSLAERTRISMASAGQHALARPQKPAITMAKAMAEPGMTSEDSVAQPFTLLERTRQSIARLPAYPDQPLKSRKSMSVKQSRQSVYPVNQFETPDKPKSDLSWPTEHNVAARNRLATPTEKLFGDDADVISIFKSRPKVKVSPVLSPAEEWQAVAPAVPDNEEHIDVEDDIWAGVASPGSPLGIRRRPRGSSSINGGK